MSVSKCESCSESLDEEDWDHWFYKARSSTNTTPGVVVLVNRCAHCACVNVLLLNKQKEKKKEKR